MRAPKRWRFARRVSASNTASVEARSLRSPHGFGLVARNRRLRRRQPRNRNAVRGTRNVVHAHAIAELDRSGIAAMLAANPDFQVGSRLASQLDAHLDQLAHAFLIDGGKWIRLENLERFVLTRELRVIVARKPHG